MKPFKNRLFVNLIQASTEAGRAPRGLGREWKSALEGRWDCPSRPLYIPPHTQGAPSTGPGVCLPCVENAQGKFFFARQVSSVQPNSSRECRECRRSPSRLPQESWNSCQSQGLSVLCSMRGPSLLHSILWIQSGAPRPGSMWANKSPRPLSDL